MTDINQEVPPIVEVVEAVAQTIVNPSLPVLEEDLLLVHKLATEVKTQLQGKHKGLLEIFNTLFNLC